jgi:hypothetical protein
MPGAETAKILEITQRAETKSHNTCDRALGRICQGIEWSPT